MGSEFHHFRLAGETGVGEMGTGGTVPPRLNEPLQPLTAVSCTRPAVQTLNVSVTIKRK